LYLQKRRFELGPRQGEAEGREQRSELGRIQRARAVGVGGVKGGARGRRVRELRANAPLLAKSNYKTIKSGD
jgi:hypothetical protein